MILELPPVIYLTAAHAAFAFALLIAKKSRGAHDWIGAAWIAVTAIAITRRSLILMGPWDSWYMRIVGYNVAYGPLAFLYALVLAEARPLRWRDSLHFIPAIILSVVSAVWGNAFAVNTIESRGPAVQLPFTLLGTASTISMAAYAIASLRVIRKHGVRLREFFSNITPARSLLWLNAMNWVFVLYLVPPTLAHAGILNPSPLPPWVTNAIFVLYLMIISFFIIRQPSIYLSKERPDQEAAVDVESGTVMETRYERSMIAPERLTEIETQLLQLMEDQKPYLDEDLDLKTLAALLEVTPHQLSQTLNLKVGKSFHTFVNEFRVREAEARLTNPAFDEYPILRIALDSGFNSKSSFHARFRKIKGMSPGEFRALHPKSAAAHSGDRG